MKHFKFIFTFLSFLGLVSLPDLLDNFGFNIFFNSTYSSVYDDFKENFFFYISSFWATLKIGFIAIIISLILGFIIGLFIGYFNKYLGFFENTIKFIWSLPLIAVATYLNNFLSLTPERFCIFTGVFLGIFPILSYVYRKSIEDDEQILNMAASFNLNKWTEFKYFRIKEILRISNLSSSLAQSVPLAYIGVTMGEYLVTSSIFGKYQGLGTVFNKAMYDGRYDKVYVTMFLMMALVYFTGGLANDLPTLINKILKRK